MPADRRGGNSMALPGVRATGSSCRQVSDGKRAIHLHVHTCNTPKVSCVVVFLKNDPFWTADEIARLGSFRKRKTFPGA
jgi:hypothetical protein